jgi:hypothetical protein
MVRWLVSDVPPRVSVTAEAAPGGDASEFRLTVKAHDEEFRPLDNASVRLTVRPVGGAAGSESRSFVQLNADAVSGEPGTYTATYVAHETGGYSAEATVTDSDGKMAGRTATGWTSDPAAAEFKSLKPNRALLESLAKKTGGEIVSMSGLDAFVRKLPEKRSPVMETWTYPLWNKPLVLLFALGCFVAEWGLRRSKGMP